MKTNELTIVLTLTPEDDMKYSIPISRKEYLSDYYQKNKDKLRENQKQYYLDNKEHLIEKQTEWLNNKLSSEPEFRETLRLRNKVSHKNTKFEVLSHYSNGIPKCNCCGETIIDFLSIDHINNDGNIHRKEIHKNGISFYFWLKKNNYPEGFQVLCMNCQFGKKCNSGICTHKLGVNSDGI